MKNSIKVLLYYLAWAMGIFAAGILIYGIIISF